MRMRKKRGLRPVTEETYNLYVKLLTGTFKVPVKERTRQQRKCIVNFWRIKKHLTLTVDGNKEILRHDGKKVLTVSEFRKEVLKASKHTMGAGARTVNYKMKGAVAGVSERNVRKILHSSISHSYSNAKFTNKAPLQAMVSTKVFERVQIDLVDMRRESVTSDGVIYSYVLSVIDCCSRYIFLKPLKKKNPLEIVKCLEAIFLEHGYPNIVQCDNGTEFKGELPPFLAKCNVKLIHGRPYHPQSQGKVERSNAALKKKLNFCMMRREEGVNWVNCLSKVASVLNSQSKEVLGYQTPFAVYYGRGSGSSDDIRKKAVVSSKRCANRMRNRSGEGSCSVYYPGEKILMKYPSQKRVPKKRYIIVAKVLKRNKTYSKYYVKYIDAQGARKSSWVSVEDLTSLTKEKEMSRRQESKVIFRERRRKKEHREKYYITQSSPEHEDFNNNSREIANSGCQNVTHEMNDDGLEIDNGRIFIPGVNITYNPNRYGNCQFDAVAHQLNSLGIYTTGEHLRNFAIEHLRANKDLYVEFFRDGQTFDKYLSQMSRNSTYGDHFTLQAISRKYHMQILVVSKLGNGNHRIVSDSGNFDPDLPIVTVGHFPEGLGEHYVSVHCEPLYEFLPNVSEGVHSPQYTMRTPTRSQNGSSYEFEDPTENLSPTDSVIQKCDRNVAEEESPKIGHEEERAHLLDCRTGMQEAPSEEVENYPVNTADESPVIRQDEGRQSPTSPTAMENESGEEVLQIVQDNSISSFVPVRSPPPLRPGLPLTQSPTEQYTGCPLLPDLVLEQIITNSIKMYPESLFRLQYVNRFFRNVVRRVGYPRVYINNFVMPNVPNPVCIRRIARHFGAHSGLMIRLREIIQNRRFYYAWLFLDLHENNWYEIRNVFWRIRR